MFWNKPEKRRKYGVRRTRKMGEGAMGCTASGSIKADRCGMKVRCRSRCTKYEVPTILLGTTTKYSSKQFLPFSVLSVHFNLTTISSRSLSGEFQGGCRVGTYLTATSYKYR